MAAAFAFNPDIHAHPDNLPAIRSAWMRLFHFDNIMKIEFFLFQVSFPLLLLKVFHDTVFHFQVVAFRVHNDALIRNVNIMGLKLQF